MFITFDFCFYDEDLRDFPKDDVVIQKADFFRPATMTLTSGSTGLPKAVVHNVKAHLDNAKGVCELMKFDSAHSWLLSLPLYHVSGQGIVWRWLSCGAELHFPKTDFYASLLEATHVSLVPTQLQRLLDYLQKNPSISFATRHIFTGRCAYSDRTYTKNGEIRYRNVFWLRNDGNGFYGFCQTI